jgi:hypothetical protein
LSELDASRLARVKSKELRVKSMRRWTGRYT